MTNGGRASMANVVLLEAWSKSLLGRRAECIAMGKAMAKAMIWEKMISSRSMGNDWAMMLVVDWWVVYDWPRLPWKTWPIQMKYCCHSGLSSPSWRSRVARFCGVALGPRMVIGRVAGEQVDQEERGDRDEEDDDDEQHQPLGDVTAHVCLFPPFGPASIPLGSHAPPRRRMILDRDPVVLPCGPCPRRFPLSPVARALVVGVGVVLVVAAGMVLRFWTRSGLWLDEALTVDIARLPAARQIPDALKHDGAPPLYYFLLHFWMRLFGQSNDGRALPLGRHRRR